MKKSFGIILVLIVFLSCENERLLDVQPADDIAGGNDLAVKKFSSHEEFESVLDRIPSMTNQELDAWEATNSFVSYRHILHGARVQWDTIQSLSEQIEFEKRYSDILGVDDSSNLIPVINIEVLQSIVNRKGIYETDGYLNRIIGDWIVTVAKKNASILFSADLDPEALSGHSSATIFRYTNSVPENQFLARTAETCATYLEKSYYWNPSGCKDDRMAYVSAQSYIATFNEIDGVYRYPRIKFKVWGTRRSANPFCNWSDYDTQLEYRNASYSVWAWQRITLTSSSSTSQPYFYQATLPANSVELAYNLTWDRPIGDWTFNEPISASAFSQVNIEGKSRGIDNNWIVVSCP
jgi:hypothetical protein